MKIDMNEIEITMADQQYIEGSSDDENIVSGLLCAAIFGDKIEMGGQVYKIVELHLEAARRVVFVMEILPNAAKKK